MYGRSRLSVISRPTLPGEGEEDGKIRIGSQSTAFSKALPRATSIAHPIISIVRATTTYRQIGGRKFH